MRSMWRTTDALCVQRVLDSIGKVQGRALSAREATILLELDQHTSPSANSPAWHSLFEVHCDKVLNALRPEEEIDEIDRVIDRSIAELRFIGRHGDVAYKRASRTSSDDIVDYGTNGTNNTRKSRQLFKAA